jgi:hypothetical protein
LESALELPQARERPETIDEALDPKEGKIGNCF